MIKLTQTQAKAVACKIRERIINLQEAKKQKIKSDYVLTDECKAKQHEIHEACVTVYQTSLKVGIKMGMRVSYYCTYDICDEKDIENAEKHFMDKVLEEYVNQVYPAPSIPREDDLVTDLIFESLMAEGIEDLMNKFIEPYL